MVALKFLFLYFSSILFSVLIHELGHLVAILWNGHKVTSFVVGPIGIERKEEKYVFVFRRDLVTGYVKYERNLRKTTLLSELVIISSGVLFNLVVGSLLVISAHFLTENGFFIVNGWFSIGLGLLNILPSRIKGLGIESDGKAFFGLFAFAKKVRAARSYDLEKPLADAEFKDLDQKNDCLVQLEFENDDTTEFEFVVDVFRTYLNLNDLSAALLTVEVHRNGYARFGWLDALIATNLVELIAKEASKHGFSFACKVVRA